MAITIQPADFSYMDPPERQRCEELQAKMIELLPTQDWPDAGSLWQAASAALGNEDGRYCRIYVCEHCHCLYHGDYSTNQDEDRDFCGAECELAAKGLDDYEDEDLDFGFEIRQRIDDNFFEEEYD